MAENTTPNCWQRWISPSPYMNVASAITKGIRIITSDTRPSKHRIMEMFWCLLEMYLTTNLF